MSRTEHARPAGADKAKPPRLTSVQLAMLGDVRRNGRCPFVHADGEHRTSALGAEERRQMTNAGALLAHRLIAIQQAMPGSGLTCRAYLTDRGRATLAGAGK